MDNLILNTIVVKGRTVEYHFSVSGELKKMFTTNVMYLEYEEDMSHIPLSILTIPFISCLLPIIWISHSVMWVNEVDYTFYNSLYRLKLGYQDLFPHFPLGGRFVPAKIVRNHIKNDEEATYLLFSGGLDAHTSYIRNKAKNISLINIQGWFNSIENIDKAAIADKNDIKKFSEQNNLKFDFVKSNFARIIDVFIFDRKFKKKLGDSFWHGFQHSMAFISITIPLAYKHNITEIVIASSSTIGDSLVCGSYITTDSEFKFCENGFVTHDGFELNRQDKVNVVVEYQKKINNIYPIRVCSFNDKNCCKCEKCFRTILGIVAEGGDLSAFGFFIESPLKAYFENFFSQNMALFGVKTEQDIYWPRIKKRMEDNFENIKEKEFVEWFFNFDFTAEKRKAVWMYYLKNYKEIIFRKLKNLRR